MMDILAVRRAIAGAHQRVTVWDRTTDRITLADGRFLTRMGNGVLIWREDDDTFAHSDVLTTEGEIMNALLQGEPH